MVKQSNSENKIEIVTLLLDGSFQLPAYMHAQDGKSQVNGTLTGLKYFEKVIKTEEFSHLITENPNQLLTNQKEKPKDFNSDSKIDRY